MKEVNIATINAVRGLLILKDFGELVQECGEICRIVPLKGVSLLLTLYRDSFARHVGDIDILIYPRECLPGLKALLVRKGYSPERESATSPEELKYKHKCTFKSPGKVDVDVHVDFITKKFFSKTCGTFSKDAFGRCYPYDFGGTEIYLMDQVDQWLLLAQHACFHLFCGEKWIKDLYLLQTAMTEKELQKLDLLARHYGLGKIVNVTLYHLEKHYGTDTLRISEIEGCRQPLLMKFIKKYDRPFLRSVRDRFIAAYWEFIFIDKRNAQFKAFMALLFPGLGMLMSIYKWRIKALVLLFYPIHIVWVSCCTVGFLFYFNTFRWR